MKRTLLVLSLAAALAGLAGPASAQDEDRPGPDPPQNAQPGGPDQEGPYPPPMGGKEGGDSAEPKEEEAPAVNIDSARINFQTVVEAFVADKSPEGYWPLQDKRSGKTRKLKLKAINPRSVRTDFRDGFYRADAEFTDLSEGKPFKAVFVVDFSGAQWKVAEMRVPKPKEEPPKKAKPVPPKKAPAAAKP